MTAGNSMRIINAALRLIDGFVDAEDIQLAADCNIMSSSVTVPGENDALYIHVLYGLMRYSQCRFVVVQSLTFM